MRAHQNNWGRVTGIEIGIQNLCSGSCIAGKGNRWGTLVDAQANWCDSTADT